MTALRFTPMLLVAVLTASASWSQPGSETDAVLQYVAVLESDPLGAEATERREWLLAWLTETKDYTVVVCEVFEPITGAEVPHKRELLLQQLFGNVAYQIKNPRQVDPIRLQIAGIESTLRAYSAIVRREPSARIEYFDELLAVQRRGRLLEHMTPIVAQECLENREEQRAAIDVRRKV